MPIRFPRRSSYGDGIIDAFSFDTLPDDGSPPGDPAAVRFRSIAEIMLRGIQRCVAADRDFGDESSEISVMDEPVLGNLGDSLCGQKLRTIALGNGLRDNFETFQSKPLPQTNQALA